MNDFLVNGRDGALLTTMEWSRVYSEFGLSQRQGQVLRCVFEGLGDKQIAPKLRMGLATVRTHMARLHGKLQANNRTEIVQRVWGLIHVSEATATDIRPPPRSVIINEDRQNHRHVGKIPSR